MRYRKQRGKTGAVLFEMKARKWKIFHKVGTHDLPFYLICHTTLKVTGSPKCWYYPQKNTASHHITLMAVKKYRLQKYDIQSIIFPVHIAVHNLLPENCRYQSDCRFWEYFVTITSIRTISQKLWHSPTKHHSGTFAATELETIYTTVINLNVIPFAFRV